MGSLTEKSRNSGARLSREVRGDYTASGDRWAGAFLILEAIQQDYKEATEARE